MVSPAQVQGTPKDMTINFREVAGVTILDLNGRIILGGGIDAFRDAIAGLIGDGRKMILLNFRDVPYIDSSGIGGLVTALTNVRNAGGELKLLNLTQKVRTVLEITRLYPV